MISYLILLHLQYVRHTRDLFISTFQMQTSNNKFFDFVRWIVNDLTNFSINFLQKRPNYCILINIDFKFLIVITNSNKL